MRELATKIAFHFLGLPYLWGGDDPVNGFDCSGFAIELLKSVGILVNTVDTTAQGLYNMYKDKEVQSPTEGCLVFFGVDKSHIRHVEYCIDPYHSIGASGGGSATLSRADAIKQNAYIKIRALKFKSGIVAYVDPF